MEYYATGISDLLSKTDYYRNFDIAPYPLEYLRNNNTIRRKKKEKEKALPSNQQSERQPTEPTSRLQGTELGKKRRRQISETADNIGVRQARSRPFQLSANEFPCPVDPPSSQNSPMYQRSRPRESNSSSLRLERTGIGSISALLNHDHTLATTQDSLQGSVPGVPGIESLLDFRFQSPDNAAVDSVSQRKYSLAIQLQLQTVQRLAIKWPHSIRSPIWFGRPPDHPPSILLRLERSMDIYVKTSGQHIYLPESSRDANTAPITTPMITLECFKEMIQGDGFGTILWNECGGDAFVTIEVADPGLAEAIIRRATYEADE